MDELKEISYDQAINNIFSQVILNGFYLESFKRYKAAKLIQ